MTHISVRSVRSAMLGASAAALLLLGAPAGAHATTWVVTSTGDATSEVECPSASSCTLRKATEESHQAEASESAPAQMLRSLSAPGASASHGEGIGLSIVKRLCELLDASLELETAPGTGTTFRVVFPRSYP